jgi:hypothetical protein
MKKVKAHCLNKINEQGEWKFRDELKSGALLGLTHFINQNADKDATQVCIMLGENKFKKSATKFNKASYREFEETLYVSERGKYQLVASESILSELLSSSAIEPEQFYIEIIKI